MQTIKIAEFKTECLHLINKVNETNEEIIITKNGKPISRLVPYKTNTLFGLHKDSICSADDLIAPIEDEWNANS